MRSRVICAIPSSPRNNLAKPAVGSVATSPRLYVMQKRRTRVYFFAAPRTSGWWQPPATTKKGRWKAFSDKRSSRGGLGYRRPVKKPPPLRASRARGDRWRNIKAHS